MILLECRDCKCLLGCKKAILNRVVTKMCNSCPTVKICFIHIIFRANEFIPTLADGQYLCKECVNFLLGGDNGKEQ